MKKKDLLKLAMIGFASGACIASQYSASNDVDLDQLLAMTKCTKEQKQERDMDKGSCGGNSCGSCGGSEEDQSSCSGSSDSCSNGRKATRDEIFGRQKAQDQEMDQKRCGKFY